METAQENDGRIFSTSSVLEIFLWSVSEQYWINVSLYVTRFSVFPAYFIAYNIDTTTLKNVVSSCENLRGLGIIYSLLVGII